ncbi:PTS sugar transporter subunit IIC [Listeria monocytogenes]|nr:PTS sugar transporter subunit IIC [Listeria monocytogenes]EAC5475444.1 PTS sugar transporter subunit IIC [Listeria monocytogenes]EAC5558227.1 PTS sugar transporter subunit IIC [Listeria monocytogenes]EAC9448154.1 PTS sugar transporter subunit IIC [Listeria monocytogenes]EAC9673075.1 PTS sugar transporter subunit IIC [Listeria monocytogenes]
MENSIFIDKLSRFGDKVGNNIYLQAISQGGLSALPVIVVGSFASLFAGLPIHAWQNFIHQTGLAGGLGAVVNATTNLLGLLFTYGICKKLSEKMEIKAQITPILAAIVYIILLPVTISAEGGAVLSFDYLGSKGMVVGILVSIITCKLYKFVIDKNITIKMPEGTPSYVSDSFLALIPAFVIIIFAMIVSMLVKLTPYDNIFNLIYSILQIPLTALMGTSLLANAAINLLVQASWALGIHPGYITGTVGPIMFALDGANQAAYAAGQQVPNIVGMAFSYITTTAVLYPAIAISILLFAKSGRLRTVGKVAVAPAFFGISEPLIFGLPIVLNPLILIPWLIAPVLNFVVGYILVSTGLVARAAGVIVFNVPMIFTGLLNGSYTISLMEIGLFMLDILLFFPFIKILDKKYSAKEQAEIQE